MPDGIYYREKIENKIIPTMIFDIKEGHRNLNPSVGCKIMKKNLFLKITDKNEENINWGEDALITYPMICIANSIYIDNHPYYHYYMNEESSTHSFSYEIIDDLRRFKSKILELLDYNLKNTNWEFQVDCYMRTYVDMLLEKWFGIHRTAMIYIFPYSIVPYNSDIHIYGAGKVGKSYIAELAQSRYANIKGWYDKSKFGEWYCNVPINNPKNINVKNSEYIIIALSNEKDVKEIINKLIKKGIKTEQIKWNKPVLRA